MMKNVENAARPLNQRRMVVTAALPYANGDIHLGHLVEYCEADFWTRFQKMRGHECLYICADDTHGTPVMLTARKLGITPEQLINQKQVEHERDFAAMDIKFDHYSSTNSDENRQLCGVFFAALRAKNHVEQRAVEQLYSEKDRMFLPDRFIKGTCPKCSAPDQYGDSCDKCGATYSPTEMKNPRSALSGESLVLRQSEHLFVKLNDFKSFLMDWIPKHTADDVAKKMSEWFAEDLRDWDISRDEPYFGFSIPGFPGKFFYVWVDAPIGYVSSTWQWCLTNNRDLKDFWQSDDAEIHHFIGKDIVYFHTLFWPAMLRAAGYSLPTRVHVHGFLTVDGEKMSKSKGTFITARHYATLLDPTYLRYYYACKLNGRVEDIDLNLEDFTQRVNSDLIGKVVNLGSRSAQMLSKKLDGRLSEPDPAGAELLNQARGAAEALAAHYERRQFSHLISEIRALADEANKYFDAREPWKLIKTDPEETRRILTSTLNVFRILTIYLKPIVPRIAAKVETLFREGPWTWASAQELLTDGPIGTFEHLIQRLESETVQKLKSLEQNAD